jgi:hypothetical protein
MNGRFIASTEGAPCCRCGSRIRIGADVYYAGPRLDDDGRTCGECVETDLFGVLV